MRSLPPRPRPAPSKLTPTTRLTARRITRNGQPKGQYGVAAAAAPAILPHVARELTGLDPESEEFTRGYAEDLARLVRYLREGRTATAG